MSYWDAKAGSKAIPFNMLLSLTLESKLCDAVLSQINIDDDIWYGCLDIQEEIEKTILDRVVWHIPVELYTEQGAVRALFGSGWMKDHTLKPSGWRTAMVKLRGGSLTRSLPVAPRHPLRKMNWWKYRNKNK